MSVLKNDKLDAMILLSSHVLAEKNAEALLSVDTSGVEISNAFNKRIKRMINHEYRKHEYADLYFYVKKAVAVLMIVCSISFALVMSVEAVRETLWNTIIQFFEDYISVSFVSYEETPTAIEQKKKPYSIPEDWKSEIKIDSMAMYYIQYLLDDKRVMTFQQTLVDTHEDWHDNDNSLVETISIGENEGKLVTLLDENQYIIIWTDGVYSYTIKSDNRFISREQIMEIALSVK